MPSVAFLVNTSSSGAAPTNAAMRARARLVGVGGLLGQLVRAAMHGRVVLLEELALGVEHRRGRCDVAPESR